MKYRKWTPCSKRLRVGELTPFTLRLPPVVCYWELISVRCGIAKSKVVAMSSNRLRTYQLSGWIKANSGSTGLFILHYCSYAAYRIAMYSIRCGLLLHMQRGLSGCQSRAWALQKWMNRSRSRCHFMCGLVGLKQPRIRWGPHYRTHRKGHSATHRCLVRPISAPLSLHMDSTTKS